MPHALRAPSLVFGESGDTVPRQRQSSAIQSWKAPQTAYVVACESPPERDRRRARGPEAMRPDPQPVRRPPGLECVLLTTARRARWPEGLIRYEICYC
jgi:hypothetical protein